MFNVYSCLFKVPKRTQIFRPLFPFFVIDILFVCWLSVGFVNMMRIQSILFSATHSHHIAGWCESESSWLWRIEYLVRIVILWIYSANAFFVVVAVVVFVVVGFFLVWLEALSVWICAYANIRFRSQLLESANRCLSNVWVCIGFFVMLFSLTFISFCLRIVSHSLDQCLNSFPISFTVQWKWYNLMTNFATVFLVFLFSITLSIGLFHRNVDQTKSENVFTLNIHGIGSVRIRLLNCFLSHLGHWFHDFRVDAITYRHNQIMFGIIYAYRHVFGLFAYWVNGFILLVVWRLTIFDRWAWMSVSFSYFRFSFWCVFLKVMVPFTVFFFVFSFERWSTQTHKFSLHSIMEWFRWACVPTLNTIKFKWNIFLFILGVFFFCFERESFGFLSVQL